MQSPFGAVAVTSAAAALLVAVQPWPSRAEAFGRWQQRPSRCSVVQGLAPRIRCQEVRLDQRSPEVLRLSLQVEGQVRGEWMQLTLVGALAEGSTPMNCQNGACSLDHPLAFSLISLSQARFDRRGLVMALPRTWPVRGACEIDPSHLRCEAVNAAEPALPWSIEAQLR